MKNFKFLALSFLFLSLCAFQCEDDNCNFLDDTRTNFDLELSSEEASFSVGDEINITASFSSTFPLQNGGQNYSTSGQTIFYDFELFEVQADNQPVTGVGEKIDMTSSSTIKQKSEEIFKNLEIECTESCSIDIKLTMQEKGYYGLVFKTGDHVTMTDCVVVTVTGIKSDVQNIDILDEIGTQTISYETSFIPVPIVPTNSFFFKVD